MNISYFKYLSTKQFVSWDMFSWNEYIWRVAEFIL